MADRLGISLIQYGRIERGNAKINIQTLNSISKILETDIVKLIGLEDKYTFINSNHTQKGNNSIIINDTNNIEKILNAILEAMHHNGK